MNERQAVLRRAIDLVLAIYRLTEHLPKDEILARQLRKEGNELVGDLTMENFFKSPKRIEALLNYFEIGRAQMWVKEINWQILDDECRRIKQLISFLPEVGDREGGEKIERVQKKEDIVSHNIRERNIITKKVFHPLGLSLRQSKLLGEIELRKSIKMSDLIPLFKDQASERTLRNDLRFLIKKRLINKAGDRKSSLYFRR
ncbi:MAG: hypothetical protein V1684_02630 [bacterium]